MAFQDHLTGLALLTKQNPILGNLNCNHAVSPCVDMKQFPDKYACHITHLCTTELMMYSICRPHGTAHTGKKIKQIAALFTML